MSFPWLYGSAALCKRIKRWLLLNATGMKALSMLPLDCGHAPFLWAGEKIDIPGMLCFKAEAGDSVSLMHMAPGLALPSVFSEGCFSSYNTGDEVRKQH